MNRSGNYNDDIECSGDICEYDETYTNDMEELVSNINNIPQSQPDFNQIKSKRKKDKHFDPSSIMDAKQIPNAYIAYSDNDEGEPIPSVYVGNVPYTITMFMPNVIKQIQERQNRQDQMHQQPNHRLNDHYEARVDETRLKLEQERLLLEKEHLALERERLHLNNNVRLNENMTINLENQLPNNESSSIITPMLRNWNKSFLVFVLIFLLLNPYVSNIILEKIPYMTNQYISFICTTIIIMVLYHIISGYSFEK